MINEHRGPLAVIGTIGLVLSGFALSVDYPRAAGTFWSDGATYYTMAQSLAFDSDLTYQREDVVRVILEHLGLRSDAAAVSRTLSVLRDRLDDMRNTYPVLIDEDAVAQICRRAVAEIPVE